MDEQFSEFCSSLESQWKGSAVCVFSTRLQKPGKFGSAYGWVSWEVFRAHRLKKEHRRVRLCILWIALHPRMLCWPNLGSERGNLKGHRRLVGFTFSQEMRAMLALLAMFPAIRLLFFKNGRLLTSAARKIDWKVCKKSLECITGSPVLRQNWCWMSQKASKLEFNVFLHLIASIIEKRYLWDGLPPVSI